LPAVDCKRNILWEENLTASTLERRHNAWIGTEEAQSRHDLK
jgi:hypothetical protein